MNTPEHSPHSVASVVILAICQALLNSGLTLTFIAASLVSIKMLGDDLTFVTAPVTMMLGGIAAGTLPGAYLMQIWGRKWGFFYSSLLGTGGGILAAYAIAIDSFFLFNIGVLCYGLYSGVGQQYRFAAANAAPAHFKEKAVSLVIAMGVVGAFVGPAVILGTNSMEIFVPYEGAFWGLAIFCLLSALFVLGIDIPKVPISADPGRPLREIVKLPKFIVAFLTAMFGFAVMNLLMTATPINMRIIDFNDAQISEVIQWHVVGMFAPGFFTGYLMKRYGVVSIVLVGCVLFFIAIMVSLSGASYTHFLIALCLVGIGWNFAFTGGTILVTEVHTPAEQARVQGFNDFIIFTCLAFISLSSGVIFHFLGWVWLNIIALPAIVFIIMAALWLRAVRRREAAAGLSS
jgi:MFS family permease